jgi:hypothetical protein
MELASLRIVATSHVPLILINVGSLLLPHTFTKAFGNSNGLLEPEDPPMKKAIPLLAAVATLFISGAADAHTLRLDCKKTTADNVVCRTILSDGEVLRDVTVQLLDENNKVLATGKVDVEGKYAFKAPTAEYNVVVEANKSHVASMSSEDIW